MSTCKQFGIDNSYPLKACRTCPEARACMDAINDQKPYYSHTVAIGFVVEKEHDIELDKMISDLKTYAKKKCKNIKTCEMFNPGLSESGYYAEK